ncbi:MAG: DotU family type IV/VI secretion system protein [Phycisphaeraceae bacterium]|nr:MAG: DotU family type IV/VI secretion system protein [Phycisphaeraceae bacterium]
MTTTEPASDLIDLCSPLFLLLASLRAAPGQSLDDLKRDREHFKRLLAEAEASAKSDPQLEHLFRQARPILVCGADGIASDSNFFDSNSWPRLEQELLGSDLGGDLFFDLLESDPHYAEQQLYEVFFVIITLGFKGRYANKPERLIEHRQQLARKLGVEKGERDHRICPEVYDRIYKTAPSEVDAVRVARLVVLAAGILGLLIIGRYVVYSHAVGKLSNEAKQGLIQQ